MSDNILSNICLNFTCLVLIIGVPLFYLVATGSRTNKPTQPPVQHVERGTYYPPEELYGPELDEVTIYKKMAWNNDYQAWQSPDTQNIWWNGRLTADRKPTPGNRHGIYGFKNRRDAERYVTKYIQRTEVKIIRGTKPIAEHDKGYRVYRGEIIG